MRQHHPRSARAKRAISDACDRDEGRAAHTAGSSCRGARRHADSAKSNIDANDCTGSNSDSAAHRNAYHSTGLNCPADSAATNTSSCRYAHGCAATANGNGDSYTAANGDVRSPDRNCRSNTRAYRYPNTTASASRRNECR